MMKFVKMFKSEKGFTLIELIFVVIILAVLAGIALVNLGSSEDDAKAAAVKADFQTIATALKVYKAKENKFPDDLSDLATDGAKYKAMLDEVPNDPYATGAYGYTNNTTSAKITSAKPDSKTVK